MFVYDCSVYQKPQIVDTAINDECPTLMCLMAHIYNGTATKINVFLL